uniref:Uncharacterized protein LOC105638026 n=1 Tax=Rhizophora mucronata TaxID=61149 RepID=A0A2P2KYQ4_RHIMU
MASYEGEVSFSSRSKLDKETNIYPQVDDYDSHLWPVMKGVTTGQSGSRSVKDYLFQFPSESEDFVDEGYDSGDNMCNLAQSSSGPPEVNLKNVLSGLFAIITGQNKAPIVSTIKQLPSSNVSFLESEKNGDTYLHSSVYTPSAPPLLEPNGINHIAYREVLEAEPPEWVPDSSTTACMQCIASLHCTYTWKASLSVLWWDFLQIVH